MNFQGRTTQQKELRFLKISIMTLLSLITSFPVWVGWHIKTFYPNALKILINANGSTEIITDANEFGLDEYREKPFTTKLIKNALIRFIKKGDTESYDH